MREYSPTPRPESWAARRKRITRSWTVPFIHVEWIFEWAAFFLGNWKFLEVLEYLGSLSVLVAVIFYVSESGDRTMQRHFQAWQVINTAQGKGGSGGRIEALEELNADRVPLVAVVVSDAFLRGIQLQNARLARSNFSSADARNSSFRFSNFTDSDLHFANFRQGDFYGALLTDCDMSDADFSGADLTEADLTGATLDRADLSNTTLRGIHWQGIKSLSMANIYGVKDAPDGFVAWALKNGAVETQPAESDPPQPSP
jgi:hypothetical protein